ncbi:MAG TPA: DUF4276 family protein [Candidatus Desulfovibrio intestinipullorum]|uniref:DUF4276 family protein n=1 Tax=Candidatus Desulfovibrio intestinipullorum TaxID=2838536 RepID=A0A9D1PW64_9BACT|nr:DUF4276 family protein [Candidatus Desulfovibrio intestinipullorum]
MTRIVNVICEGQTELSFVQAELVPYLISHGVLLIPTQIGNAGGARGGHVTMERLFRDAKQLLAQRNNVVTTMLDYYGLAGSWPFPDTTARTAHEKGCALECAVAKLFDKETKGGRKSFSPILFHARVRGPALCIPTPSCRNIGPCRRGNPCHNISLFLRRRHQL